MKKIILPIVILIVGWCGFAYLSAAWTRERFINEVDSFLASPRDLGEQNLPPLILNKARQFGIELRPEDIQVRIESTDRETTTSRLIENKGFKARTQTLSLHIRYTQTILGISKTFSLDRERSFTASIAPSAPSQQEPDEPPDP